jgi:uncharacterized RDD family membrane protein YckC
MNLDVNTLFFITIYVEAILGLLLLFAWIQNAGIRGRGLVGLRASRARDLSRSGRACSTGVRLCRFGSRPARYCGLY